MTRTSSVIGYPPCFQRNSLHGRVFHALRLIATADNGPPPSAFSSCAQFAQGHASPSIFIAGQREPLFPETRKTRETCNFSPPLGIYLHFEFLVLLVFLVSVPRLLRYLKQTAGQKRQATKVDKVRIAYRLN